MPYVSIRIAGNLSREQKKEMRKGKGWKKGMHRCVRCGCWGEESDDMIYGADPYASEIHGNYTSSWQCMCCRHESCMEI